jgi:MFS transporter, MHS family, citrate/tricarballylate:H+ symporter
MPEMNNRTAARRSIPARHVAAVVAGNALEFYDFLTYAFFAIYIGRAFFPSDTPSASLLAALGTFGVGFVTRPIGSWVIGRMGDRAGRKPAMILTFSLMGAAIIGLALTPPRSMIGIAAPILVVIFRMVQGFALGGEVGPTTAFLLEAAPPERRGFYTAFQAWTQHLSNLLSGLVGYVLASTLNERQLQAYGWRIAFLLGALIVPFGLLVRRGLPETLGERDPSQRGRVSMRPYWRVAAIGLLLLGSGTIGAYTLTYMTTYAITALHMPTGIAFAATIVISISGLAFDLISGVLSDRLGRKPVMIVPGALLMICIFPAFRWIAHYRTAGALMVAAAVLASLASLSVNPILTWLTESLPMAIRSGGVAVIYACAIATFGGSTQYTVTWLIKRTGNPLMPAWYWTIAAVIGLAAMFAARETAPRKIAAPEAQPAPVPGRSA